MRIANLEKETELVICDLFGEEQRHLTIAEKTAELALDLSALKSGLYLVILKNESGTSTLKIYKK